MILFAAAAAVTLTGCVSKKSYTRLDDKYNTMSKDYAQAQYDLAASRSDAKNLQSLLD